MSLEIDNLRLRRGAFDLAVTASIPTSGVTVLFGPSGAGKSMLLSALAGLARIDTGRITLDGQALDDVPPHRRDIGLLFQDARLFPHLSVRGNLDYARRRVPAGRIAPDLDAIAECLEIAALLDRPVRNLSGGEKSRVALARALLSAPRILLLDEPFAALDSRRRRDLLDLLRGVSQDQQLPMLVVTHLVEDAAEIADHVVALNAGRVVAQGEAGAAMADPAFLSLLDPRDIGARLSVSAIGVGQGAGVWVRADSVLVAGEAPRALSARHVWPGVTAFVRQEESGAMLVAIDTALGRVLARITPEAAAELNLAAGREVWAVVKTHAL